MLLRNPVQYLHIHREASRYLGTCESMGKPPTPVVLLSDRIYKPPHWHRAALLRNPDFIGFCCRASTLRISKLPLHFLSSPRSPGSTTVYIQFILWYPFSYILLEAFCWLSAFTCGFVVPGSNACSELRISSQVSLERRYTILQCLTWH